MFNSLPSPRKLARMNPRQRKKLRLGEFQELVFEIQIRFKQAMEDSAFDAFLDEFIAFVESRDLLVGALGGQLPIEQTDGIVFAADRQSPTEEDKQAVADWLKQHSAVADAQTSELIDAWYGWGQA